MDENSEGLDTRKEDDESKKDLKDDDVDIYGDLESTSKGLEANSNVIERFNRLFSPKKRFTDEDYQDFSGSGEEDVDLYDDLNTFENHIAAEELEAKVESLEQKCSALDKENTELKTELDKVNKVNLMLKRNISSIFKTAKAELERKERQLKELQREHDSLVFRRGNAANNRTQAASKNAFAEIPGCQILKKDSTKGNLVTIENETECMFQMGPVTISFMTESMDFKKRRLDRFEEAPRDKKTVNREKETFSRIKPKVTSNQSFHKRKENEIAQSLFLQKSNPSLETGHHLENPVASEQLEAANQEKNASKINPKNLKETGLPPLQEQSRKCTGDSRNLEDGEVSEGEIEEIESQASTNNEQRESTRRKEELECVQTKRSDKRETTHRKEDSISNRRTRSSSRSSGSGKRKRSPSVDRRHSNNRPSERELSKRSRLPRSPIKAFRSSGFHRNSGNSYFNSRGSRR